ncbi:MAG: DNA repair protein RadC [Alysiella sp.]|uniref:RadC family protein n=1 Tax=Alysiella sp. TaxID=1872483 RepID=UPI0026DA6FB8|nr:DNA repair protein RadC [Alysiella sp.]MDO4432980.1 DNA repair protein RadC [Alysiella sp.]
MSIKDWPEGERPREKLLERGAAALSDAELLAVLLRIGTQGMSAVDLARSLLQHYGGLGGVMNASRAELSQHKGMGSAAYAQFAAVLEIGRRVLYEELHRRPVFDNPQTLGDYLRLLIGREKVEVAMVVFLNAQNQLLACEEIARGTVDEHTVYIREMVKRALQHHAVRVVFAHNHPTGSLMPSHEDHRFTSKLRAALALLDMELSDHLIVGAQEVLSFRQQGWL